MSQVGRFLVELDKATRRWHADADAPWLDLLHASLRRQDYIDHLVRMYGFEAPLESACAYTPQLGRVLDYRQLRRAGSLAQDLLALGMTPAELASLPQCFSITPFRDVPEALGWRYVVERSTLHHRLVHRVVLDRVPEASHACAYLRMFEGADAEHWRAFTNTLELFAARTEVATQIVEAADAAFAELVQWCRTPRLRNTG